MKFTEIEISELLKASKDTLYQLIISGAFIVVIGLILGFILFFTEDKSSKGIVKVLHRIVSLIVDIARSIPFVILMVILIPLTIILVGTMLGAKAALPALIISASPFYARVVYMSLRDVDKGKIEALKSMGASNITIVVYLAKEALPSLISGITVTLVTLVGFIASAGAIGAGGLGDLAVRKAFANDYKMAYVSVFLVLIIVFIIQILGDYLSKKIDKR
ncbi:MAG: methionine ABC transporter permease [Acholeplasma sp.]|nr:methionine ABC transporter permease [Acholeplasma sp.]